MLHCMGQYGGVHPTLHSQPRLLRDGSSVCSGDYGLGKIGLAAPALFGRVALGQSVLCIDWKDFAAQVQSTYGRKRGDGPSADDLIRAAANTAVLLINELGHSDYDEQGNCRSEGLKRLVRAVDKPSHQNDPMRRILTFAQRQVEAR